MFQITSRLFFTLNLTYCLEGYFLTQSFSPDETVEVDQAQYEAIQNHWIFKWFYNLGQFEVVEVVIPKPSLEPQPESHEPESALFLEETL